MRRGRPAARRLLPAVRRLARVSRAASRFVRVLPAVRRLARVSPWLRRTIGVVVTAACVTVAGTAALPASAAADPCGPLSNAIVCENSKPGTPDDEWDIQGVGDPSIQGFATEISVNRGQQVKFKIKTDATAYTIDIYRLGYYGGTGARKVATLTPSAPLPQNQPACVTQPTTEIVDCGTWGVSATWTVPSTAVSGVYIAKPVRTDTGGASHIPFVVRDDAGTSALFFQTSDSTWQAYNSYGGSNFYGGGANGRAYKLSYNRPFATRGDFAGRDFLFSTEYPMLRFLERNGYDVSYTTNVDTDRRGSLIQNHKIFLSVGHDEYWSNAQRLNVEAARDAGVHLAFFSGNEVYWKTRWESSVDGSGTPYRTLVCYKETWANADIDPTSEWTGTWRDPRFTPPADGGRPENALTGTAYVANHSELPLTVPAEQGKFRLWRNTVVAQQTGGALELAPYTVGYESNEDLANGFRPHGLIRLSTTVGETPQYLRDFGNTVTPGSTTHHLTMYRASSGALVFSAGSIQFAWGLDANHDGAGGPADPSTQQAVVNLFADMGVQPGSLMSGLVPATASTDTTPATATITQPAEGASVANGAQVTISGTATDSGGRVAGVEVSTDGGETWNAANGTSVWSFTFVTNGLGSQQVQVRAMDDSANIGQPATRQLTLSGPSSLFGARVPGYPSTDDASGIEVGVRFSAQTNGFIAGIRFYKGTGNTGTHTGSLWTNAGTRLATGTFTGETASGWQNLTFTQPVPITAGTRYVASYYTPSGHYAADPWYFSASDVVRVPLVGLRSGGTGNGLFKYGGGFPTESYQDTNYYVDALFTASDESAPAVLSTSPLDGSADIPVATDLTATFSKAVNPATIQFTLSRGAGGAVAGSTSYNSTTRTATFNPSTNLDPAQTYTATVSASDTDGHPMGEPFGWTFSTELDPSVSKLFPGSVLPANVAVNDGNSVELGVKFVPASDGTVVGVRYYQGPGNTGTHIGNLWTGNGTLLARVTFGAGTGSGWQTALFDTPVPVTAGNTYVASYFAPNGHYAASANFFTSPWTNGPLSAPAGNNGTFQYGSGTQFPNGSYNSTNYFVDPLFVAGGTAPPPSSLSLFLDADAPANANWPDGAAIEVGVKVRSDVAGTVTAIRFYKGALNTGTHVGTVWTEAGVPLGSVTFTGETASGWQTATLDTPIPIAAGTTYVVSYRAPAGNYAATLNAFNGTGFDRAPLHVPAGGAGYKYGGGFPDGASDHNYWVDVVFQPN